MTAELETTQHAIEDILPVLDSQSSDINNLKNDLQKLKNQFQTSFLQLAINQISRDDLTLSFLAPEDVQKLVYDIIELGNLTFKYYDGSIPIVEIITNLLVRQQINFVPVSQYNANDPNEIGRLVITSFFAVPHPERTPFYTYRLVTIPFFHENETIELAQIPKYWAINPENNTTMQWSTAQESKCNLQQMISCRDTPPIRTISKDTCLDQIVGRSPLSRCDTTSVITEKFFLRQLRDNFWITSSPNPINCVKVPRTEYFNAMRRTWSSSEEITLPPVALVNVTEGYAIVCPGFILVGRPPIANVSSVIIMHNNYTLIKNISVMNVYKYITKNMTWFRKKMTQQEKEAMMSFVDEVKAVTPQPRALSTYLQSFAMSALRWVSFAVAAALLWHAYRCIRRNK
jgi:hypothetical protein